MTGSNKIEFLTPDQKESKVILSYTGLVVDCFKVYVGYTTGIGSGVGCD